MRGTGTVLALALTTATAQPAQATSWRHVAEHNNGSVWYVDTETIRQSGGFRYFWLKIDATRNKSVKFFEEKRYYKADCATRSVMLISFMEYDESGKVVNSNTVPEYGGNSGMQLVPPETIGDDLLNMVCV